MLTSAYLLGGWLIRLAMIPVVARRHRPFVAMAWLAPIFLFPVMGTLLYLWLSVYGLKRSADGHRRVREEVERDDRLREQREHQEQPEMDKDPRQMVRLSERLSTREMGGFPILGGNTVQLLDRPGEAVARMIEDIDAAERNVHLMFFIYVDDGTGRRVAEALARAAARGVRCRVLVDAWASRAMRGSLGPWMRRHGIELHPVLPMHPLRQPLARVDVRNHRKLAVVDGRAAFTGSTNIHDPDHALDEGIWHQISVRVEGPAALQLQMLFVEDWYFATGEMLAGEEVFPPASRPGGIPVQTVPDGPSYGANILQHTLVQALQLVDQRAVLTTPYFIPDDPLLLGLRLAALRGAEVDLLLPRRSDRRIADLAGRAFLEPLLDAGVRVHLHPSGIVHAKTLTVDEDFALLGTANFDRRSLFLNYEVMLLVYQSDLTRALRRSQQRLLEEAEPLHPGRWGSRPELEKVVQHTARLLSPVL